MSDRMPERDTVRPDPSANRPDVERDRAPAAAPVTPSAGEGEARTDAQPRPTTPPAAAPATRVMPVPPAPAPARTAGTTDGHARPAPDTRPDPRPDTRTGTGPETRTEARADEHAAAWSQLQAQFVDDPAAAVKNASELVEKAVQRLLHRSGDHDTEELRTAFLRYRDLHRTLSRP